MWSNATGLGKMEHPGGSSRAEGGEQPASAAQPGSTPRGHEKMTDREMVEFLWGLLDDIDTTSDMAKGDDGWYRRRVEKIQRRRFECGITTDGYDLYFPPKKPPEQRAQATPVRLNG